MTILVEQQTYSFFFCNYLKKKYLGRALALLIFMCEYVSVHLMHEQDRIDLANEFGEA